MRATQSGTPSDFTIVRDALADDYDVIEELGRGGMAVVYRARERALDRDVAIKVVPLARVSDGDLVERFQREARLSAQLAHPHIVPIYRVGRRDGVIFFVMPLLRDESLGRRLEREGTLCAAEVRRVLVETASALGYAHRRGIVHRDIKPDNIVFDQDGRCVVTDFGIARSLYDAKLTATGMSAGTPRYMSPEQARATSLDGRSDIYSLGVLAYECLVGRTPFDGDDAFAILLGHIQSPVPRPRLASAEERALFFVIERMLAKRREDRYQTAEELTGALQALGSAATSAARGARPDPDATEFQTDVAQQMPVDPHDSGPQPSPALAAALRAGVEMLWQQGPRVEARVVAGREFLQAKTPHVRSGVARAIRSAHNAVSRLAGKLVNGVLAIVVRLRTLGLRFWLPTAAIGMTAIAAYYTLHFVTMHRSRCPELNASTAATPLGDAAHPGRPRGFSILADAVGTQPGGSDLDIYYDVCGLEEGTAFSTRVSVVKNESGLRRLFGSSVEPIVVSYDETARGPATRRHRTLSFEAMPPGSYTMDIVVIDGSGRRREKDLEFQVIAR